MVGATLRSNAGRAQPLPTPPAVTECAAPEAAASSPVLAIVVAVPAVAPVAAAVAAVAAVAAAGVLEARGISPSRDFFFHASWMVVAAHERQWGE